MSAKVKTHDQRKKAHRPKGPWLNRVFIGMLTFCFGLLTFIFEGFVLRDIETIRQPDWETYRSQRSDQSLSELQVRSSELGRQLADLDRQIKRQEAEQRVLQDGSRNLQETMRQLVELQRLSIQKEVAMSEGGQANLSTALNQFLETQTRYQSFNKQLQDQHETKRLAEDEKRSVDDQVQQATAPIRTGPRRFLYWIRRTVHKTIPPQASSGQPLQDEPYSCPSCGTTLFEDCRQCGHSQHSLLPHCSHCGEGSEDEVVKHDLKGTEI